VTLWSKRETGVLEKREGQTGAPTDPGHAFAQGGRDVLGRTPEELWRQRSARHDKEKREANGVG